jgi:hypothetical protein
LAGEWDFDFQKSGSHFLFLFSLVDFISGVCGKLEGERIVGALIEGRSWWFQTESLPFQHQVESAVDLPNPPSTSAIPTSTTDTPAWVPVEDWRKVISYLLPSQDIMIRIKIVTEPIPNSN